MADNKKMGGMGKLSSFSGIQRQGSDSAPKFPEKNVPETNDSEPPKTQDKMKRRPRKQEKLVNVNIKIPRSQKDWLTSTAQTIRDNNLEPVAPADRVYPQHLIGVAIDYLKSADIDWDDVRNIQQLRQLLDL
ncbi:hypothetical protein JJD41_16970 [Oxynema sp. CENA135]|uniref:hypothetical protein n=1 Tax=Oxynema sp. CENA135 TaxID=984206 RepID=UPI00190D5B07|nr:hypothetical protein [Oxynema sp. CENA135]MBK4731544.1 hypothetical protein [Oxynema sp. CENA135]